MAPIPSSSQHQSGRSIPRNIQTTLVPNSERSTNADLNRPLPPPPASASAESYEIPSLRRKPVPGQLEPDSSKHNHNRSFSHPFPSLFGSKRSDKRHNTRGDVDITPGGSRDIRHDEAKAKLSGAEGSAPRGDRQPVTGKCMTCDSTVRWPQGLKVFRCTTCLTINDLEFYPENGADGSNGPSPPRKIVPLSLETTRSLLDRCLNQYLVFLVRRHSSGRCPIWTASRRTRLSTAFSTSNSTAQESFGAYPDHAQTEP